jgi:AcrR family transcriptional regulator
MIQNPCSQPSTLESTHEDVRGLELMASSLKRTRRQKPPHPTSVALLEAAVDLLDTVPMEGVSLAMILERTGISHGSLYHHFEDFPDLIEKAVVHRYARRLRESLFAVRSLLDSSDRDEFRARVEELLNGSISDEGRKNRLDRIEVLGALQGHPRLVDSIAQAQQAITDEQAEIYIEFQNRGWIRSDLDPFVMSAFIQAMIVGRIVDDVTERPVGDVAWRSVALPAFRAVLFAE